MLLVIEELVGIEEEFKIMIKFFGRGRMWLINKEVKLLFIVYYLFRYLSYFNRR